MSQENVEVVRRILEAWAQGDFRTHSELLASDIKFETFMPDASENVTATGFGELEAFTRDWLAQWRDYRIEADEFRQVSPNTVFVSLTQAGVGCQSGVPVAGPGFSVWKLTNGKVAGLSLHYDRQEALEAAGLSE